MAERHLDPLFSAAYDGELDQAARRRFDAHLEGCARCAGAFEDYRTALDAVRMLPVVAMPATVRLPVGAPRAASRAALLGRLRDALLHPQPVTAAATMAAVGIAAVVLAVHHGGGGTTSTAIGGSGAAPQAASAPDASKRQDSPLLGIAPVPCPVAPVPAGGSASAPAGFPHAASTAAATGGELVLATPADSYAPGESVPIYARLTTTPAAPGAPTAVVPCVTLETEGSQFATAPRPAVPALGAGAAGAPAADGSAVQPTPLAVATSGSQAFSAAGSSVQDRGAQGSGPLLSVTIPPGVARGTVLRLVAEIPAHYPGNPGDSPVQVVLLIRVR